MEVGNQKHSPIVDAIREAEAGTTGEIRVHLTQRWHEKDPYHRAEQLFFEFAMHRTAQRNGVLVYVNLRKKKFAIIVDTEFYKKTEPLFWEKLKLEFADHLRSTQRERAIALTIRSIGTALKKWFPIEKF